MGITRPTGEQLRFRSQFTGDHVLDTYLEASEKGSRQLSDLLDDLFDSSGTFRAANFEFQFDPSVDKIQFRAGNFANPSAGWTDITTFFNITGTFNASTTYQNFDLATTSDKDVYIVHGLSSGTTFADEAAFIASSNTTRIVDVSEARDWAKKTDGIVSSTDYSSKAWAIGGTGVTNSATGGAAKEWAIKTSGTVDGTNYSAKYWATSTDVVTVSTNIADVTTVATDISNVNTVSTNISNVNTTASNIASVNTVAAEIGVGQDVTVVAANIADIGTAATNIANINTAAGSIANVNTVATSISNVNTVSTNIANVNTVAPYVGTGNDITVVAAEINSNNLQTVAADIQAVIDVADDLNEATSEIDTVANSIANVDTVGTNITSVNTVSTNIANVNTTATDISNVNTVATNLGAGNDVTVVAANIADVNTVAGISSDVTTAATNVTAFNNTYLGAQSSAPTADPDSSALDLGDLYFDTTTSTMKVYSASGWINAGSSVNGTADRFTYTATASQTTFTGNDDNTNSLAYDAGFLDVYMNGVKLVNGSDFTATNGTSIVLSSAAALNDTIEIIAYGTFVLADHLTETQSDAKYVNVTGDTMTGNLGIGISPVAHNGNAKTLHVDGGANASELRLTNTTTGSASSNGFHIAQVGNTSYVVQNENAPLNFYTNGAYAAQFDASGNFMVGTDTYLGATSPQNGTQAADAGFAVEASGVLQVGRYQNSPVRFNRMGNDGAIAEFKKDGTSVGWIQTSGGDIGLVTVPNARTVFIGGANSGGSARYLNFDLDVQAGGSSSGNEGGAFFPSVADVTDLGTSNNRFYSHYLKNATYYGTINSDQFIVGKSGADNRIWDRSGGDIEFLTADLQRFIIKNSEVVVNDDSYDVNFRVESNNYTHTLLVDAGNDVVSVGTNSANSNYAFHVSGVNMSRKGIRIDTDGDTTQLSIGGNGNVEVDAPGVAGGRFLVTNSGSTIVNEAGNGLYDFRVESDNSDHMLFVDAGNDRIGVNNASPSSTVHIGRSGLSNTGLTIQSATTSALITLNGRMNNSGSTTTAIEFKDGSTATTEGSITVTSSGTTYNTTSDRRLKTDIQPIENGTEKLMAMNPVTHKWKADPHTGETVHGFIAQEMQEIVPEAVSGDPEGEEMMSMDYGRITPVLVAALQDAHKKIEALEERLAELEAK